MASQTDTVENAYITSKLTIVPGSDGNGDLEISGAVYSNQIFENTENEGVDLESTVFSDKTFTISNRNINTIVTPTNNKKIFFLDSVDNKFKSIDSSGILTVYQPSTTKGDLVVHDGTTQVRLPSGSNGQVLTVNTASANGVEWANSSGGGSGTSKNNILSVYLTGTNGNVINQSGIGAFCHCVTPYVENGASLNYFFTKSSPNGTANTVKFNINDSLIANLNFNNTWGNYKGNIISKAYTEGNGEYEIFTPINYTKSVFTLTGTTPVSLASPLNAVSGLVYVSIYSRSANSGPVGNYILIKNNSASNTFLLNTINSSSGTGGNVFNFTWNSGTGITIAKSVSGNNNGEYVFVNNFENQNIISTVALSGTSSVIIPEFLYYDKKSCFLKVVPSNASSGAPHAIFFISKNANTKTGNITRISAPGLISSTNLNLTWNVNSLLSLSKSNGNYNESYIITFSH